MARTLAVSVIALAVAAVWISLGAAANPPLETTVFAIGKCFDPNQPAQRLPARFDYNRNDTGVMDDMTWTAPASPIPSSRMRGIRCRRALLAAHPVFSSIRI